MPATIAVMPATMGNLFQFDLFTAFEDSRIRLIQLVENSVALGNTGNSPAGVRDLAEAYALLEGTLAPNVGVVHNKS